MKTILAPLDFSEVSPAVVTECAALARAFGARVHLLTVIQPPAITAESVAMLGNLTEITAAGEHFATKELEKYAAELATEGISSETAQLYGGPVEHIVEQADSVKADYIVMGSHGHSALYELLVGSTTHGVLMRAKCPVVIIPAGETAERRRQAREAHAAI